MFEPDMLSGESDLVRNANVNKLRGLGMTELDAMRQAYGAQPARAPMAAPPMQAPAPMPPPPMQAAPAATLPQPNAQAFAHASPNAAFMGGDDPLAQLLAQRSGGGVPGGLDLTRRGRNGSIVY